MSDEKLPDNILWHQSGVNQNGEPFVQLLRGAQIFAQMDPQQARDHAQAILESAEAAEQDAFIFDWVKNHIGAGETQAAGFLGDFRKYRAERTGKKGGPSSARDWVMPPNK
jgi:ABC-type nitrate/sulfonate/bicarbonate transport system substrate-binding protein